MGHFCYPFCLQVVWINVDFCLFYFDRVPLVDSGFVYLVCNKIYPCIPYYSLIQALVISAYPRLIYPCIPFYSYMYHAKSFIFPCDPLFCTQSIKPPLSATNLFILSNINQHILFYWCYLVVFQLSSSISMTNKVTSKLEKWALQKKVTLISKSTPEQKFALIAVSPWPIPPLSQYIED